MVPLSVEDEETNCKLMKSTNIGLCNVTLGRKLLPSIFLIVMFTGTVSARVWNYAEGNHVRWSGNCNFSGYDFQQVHVSNDKCGRACLDHWACTHFSNTCNTCFLKRNTAGWTEQFSRYEDCGFIPGRSNQSTDPQKTTIESYGTY
ncbi:hypothetical protein DAPPUDRAFT_325482 [Daphnia pulex]|uniref:Uncharacterized protein n=1 Tax=Daphnia pulex TaxID=6669 RepID=E9H4V1_DAPPU|nr:hypothetical protein DAPPUDRAFT_325482 [Daphnia pulex]|eukprot:EFX73209.1 hypothetical protein DAPPUDRAFT_325482 [Daphnia pulex]